MVEESLNSASAEQSNPKYIKSVSTSDREILEDILTLYIKKDTYDLDPTFSKGVIYKGMKEPPLKFDLSPCRDDVKQSDCRSLPLEDSSIGSIVFDPPFLFGNHGSFKTNGNAMVKRFSHFKSFEELESMYKDSLKEFNRILKLKGYLI